MNFYPPAVATPAQQPERNPSGSSGSGLGATASSLTPQPAEKAGSERRAPQPAAGTTAGRLSAAAATAEAAAVVAPLRGPYPLSARIRKDYVVTPA